MEITYQNIIQTKALSFSYGKYKALNDIDLHVPAGSIFGFLGPNGAGKTTTIKTLLGLLHTKPGMINIFGKELNANKMEILERTGAMVEAPSLYDHLNARQNLEITARLRNLSFTNINELLDTVSLTHEAHRAVRQYSTGMKQRLSLAIALLSEPELLILDEPINGLDPNGIIEIRKLLTRINERKKCTILLSSHILSEIEKICSHVAIINSGSLVFQGSMLSLLGAASGKETFAIATNKPEKAKILLDGKFETSIKEQSLIVTVKDKHEIALVIKILTQNEIEIYSAERETTGIEASFLHLLNESHQS